ncbi:hypothetical protein [Paracoccus sp. (in: a-proteobacteria)]|uniref:hypothetical protein n=1 Tax=Paracoccus sp. TaxID=267 RepID=UPI00396C4E96
MNHWIIAAMCCAGAGFVAWGAARLQLRWPLLALSLLLSAIAAQLFLAVQGREGFHDLAAIVAQSFTTAPALLGLLAGLALARLRGYGIRWRSGAGLLTAGALLAAAGLIAATFVI